MRVKRAIVTGAALTIGLAVFVEGCLLGPNFKSPPVGIADRWMEEGNNSMDSSAAEHRDWWTVFNDPVLSDLIQLAYQRNLTLQSAGVRVLEARARLGIAIGEFYPQKQLVGASLTHNQIPISLPQNVITNTYWSDQFGAQAAWELDFWGKLRRAIESADRAFQASVANYDDVLVTLVADVASAYVKIRTNERQIAIAHDNITRQRTALKLATVRFQYGTVARRDVYQAENVLGATEATIPQLNIQLAQTKDALSVLLGMPPGRLDNLLAGSDDIPTSPEQVIVGFPQICSAVDPMSGARNSRRLRSRRRLASPKPACFQLLLWSAMLARWRPMSVPTVSAIFSRAAVSFTAPARVCNGTF